MNRRTFLGAGLAAGAAMAVPASSKPPQAKKNFRMKYAPHFNMFRNSAGKDPIDQLNFMADEGFTALEDNGLMRKPVELQKKLGETLEKREMTMGVFVCGFGLSKPNFVFPPEKVKDGFVEGMKKAVEAGKRVNGKWTTLVPGTFVNNVEWDYQTANVIENLKYCAEVCEPHGLVMVLEPLNWWANHPGVFLTKVPQAYQICKAVGSPSVKILDDLYHQQITEGNLIPNIDKAWDEIAYFQIGDNPGRKEPTTGEINYKNIFRHLHHKSYKGVLGMEHGNSKGGVEGEKAVIAAYRECDNF